MQIIDYKNLPKKDTLQLERTSPEFKMLLMSSRNSSTTICEQEKTIIKRKYK